MSVIADSGTCAPVAVITTLFTCFDKDINVPCEGAEQMYQALRSLEIPTELVIYPNQHHQPDVPSYLGDRLQRWIDWIAKYLR